MLMGGLAVPSLAQDYTNIVLINLDDVGFGDFSCNGAYGYKTPEYRQSGITGSQVYSFSGLPAISGASRAGLLTGCYPNRIGFFPGAASGIVIMAFIRKNDNG